MSVFRTATMLLLGIEEDTIAYRVSSSALQIKTLLLTRFFTQLLPVYHRYLFVFNIFQFPDSLPLKMAWTKDWHRLALVTSGLSGCTDLTRLKKIRPDYSFSVNFCLRPEVSLRCAPRKIYRGRAQIKVSHNRVSYLNHSCSFRSRIPNCLA